MNIKPEKPSKKEYEYFSACKEIRLTSDPAAKVLVSIILDGYRGELQYKPYSLDIALIENVTGSAETVINNATEILSRIDPRFSFIFYDFPLENEEHDNKKILKIIDEIYKASDYNPMTIHIVRNISECLCNENFIGFFQDMYCYDENEELHFIYVFDESSYQQFRDKFKFTFDIHPIWLNRLPGELDFNKEAQKYSLERTRQDTVNADIFTNSGKTLMNRAQRQAELFEEEEIDYVSILLAAAEGVESSVALMQCLNLTPERINMLREGSKEIWKQSRRKQGHYLIASRVEQVMRDAIKLASASGYPDPHYPGLVSAFHLIGALSLCESVSNDFGINRELLFRQIVNKIADWYHQKKVSPSITGMYEALSNIGFKHGLYRKMSGNIFGQREALEVITEALYIAEFNKDRNNQYDALQTCFLFIGPEGSGKGHLTRSLAKTYNLPYFYYNFSYLSEEQLLRIDTKDLKNSKAMLVFDNITEAQPAVIDQLCHLVEYRKFKDRYSGQEVDFSNSIIIIIAQIDIAKELFTGKDLPYKLHNHQDAVLSYLTNRDNLDRTLPLIPKKLGNLLEKKPVVIFNQLQVEDLLNICERKLFHFGALIEKKGGKRLTYHPLIPYIILCSKGGKPKPSAITFAVEMLISTEARKFISGYPEGSALFLLTSYDRLYITIEAEEQLKPEVAELFHTDQKPTVLLLTDRETADCYISNIKNVNWWPVYSLDAVEQALDADCFDFALLDLWFNLRNDEQKKKNIIQAFNISLGWGNKSMPHSVIGSELFGDRYLQIIESLAAKKTVVALNSIDSIWDDCVKEPWKRPSSYYLETAQELRKIREQYSDGYPLFSGVFHYDLFFEFLHSYGLRGIVNTSIAGDKEMVLQGDWDCLASWIDEIHQRLYRKKMAAELSERKQMLAFTPRWELCEEDGLINVCLSDLRIIENRFYDRQQP